MKLPDPLPSDDERSFSWWQKDVRSKGQSPSRPPLVGLREADVAVVGGGFTGLWTALTLKKRDPRLRVALLDAHRCGDGASSRNGGNVHGYWSALNVLLPLLGPDKAREAAALGTLAQQKLGAFVRACTRDLWWVEEGYLRVATSPTQMAKMQAYLGAARELGAPETVRAVTGAELGSLCGSPRFLGGLHFAEGATVHPARLAAALRDAAVVEGVEIFEDSAVRTIQRGAPNLIETGRGAVRARDVVLANYTGTMAIPAVARSTTLFSSFPVMSAPNPTELERLNYSVARGLADLRMFTYYFRRTADGRMLMGSGSGPIARGNRDNDDVLRFDQASSDRAAAGLKHFFPGMAQAGIADSWGWPIEVTADRLPFFGTIPGTRIHYGSGYSGHGVNATCIAGECLASLVCAQRDRWTASPFCDRTRLRFPWEPLRYIGGRAVRAAIVTCEDAEDVDQPAPRYAQFIANIPRIVGLKIGTR